MTRGVSGSGVTAGGEGVGGRSENTGQNDLWRATFGELLPEGSMQGFQLRAFGRRLQLCSVLHRRPQPRALHGCCHHRDSSECALRG